MTSPRLLVAALAVAAAACASSQSAPSGSGASAPAPSSSSLPEAVLAKLGLAKKAPVPFVVMRSQDLRLVAASRALSARIGHDVAVSVGAPLLEEHASHLTVLLADAFETLGRALDAFAEEDRDACAIVRDRLSSIEVELDERAREPWAELDRETGALVLWVPLHATFFTTDAVALDALSPPQTAPEPASSASEEAEEAGEAAEPQP